MSVKAEGSKAGRRGRHLARQAALKERKRIRKARAARFAHLPGQQPQRHVPPALDAELRSIAADTLAVHRQIADLALDNMPVARLRELATAAGCEVRSRHRKADLIAMIQDKYEAKS